MCFPRARARPVPVAAWARQLGGHARNTAQGRGVVHGTRVYVHTSCHARGSRYMARHHDSDAHTAAARGPLWIAIGKAAAVYGSRQPDAIVPAL